jgi:small subunit ribosomal protein S8
MMTDPVADMLTRMRNAISIERPYVDIPFSRLKRGIADALKREGFVWEVSEIEGTPRGQLRVELKYGPNGERVMQHLRRVSTPGRRVYCGVDGLPNVLQGLGICLLSTNQGVLSGREAKQKNVGGEVLCEVW